MYCAMSKCVAQYPCMLARFQFLWPSVIMCWIRCWIARHCFGPPIGGFPPIFHEFPTPLRWVQICQDNGSIYEGVGPLERVKILRNQPTMASFSPANALWEQSLNCWNLNNKNRNKNKTTKHVQNQKAPPPRREVSNNQSSMNEVGVKHHGRKFYINAF